MSISSIFFGWGSSGSKFLFVAGVIFHFFIGNQHKQSVVFYFTNTVDKFK